MFMEEKILVPHAEPLIPSNDNRFKMLPAKLLPLLSDRENSVISPHGIVAVLAMAAEGASEESLRDILTALGFADMDELRKSVCAEPSALYEAFKSENALTLMKGRRGVELLEHFEQTLRGPYAASVEKKASDGIASVRLQNTASFQAEWLPKMERDTSHEHRFYHADGSYSFPAFLSCSTRLRYYTDDRLPATQAVAFPYQQNGKKLPFELVLVDTEKPLDGALLDEIFSNMRAGTCEVVFPEFSVNSEPDLIPMMTSLGLQSIFDPENAAFDRMATLPLYAEAFRQTAEIRVDQTGTAAKAMTFMLCLECKCASKTVEMKFNRPFYYFLRSTATGEILFMGRINRLADCERQKAGFDLSDFREYMQKDMDK